jgi:hypothetical protein
MVNSGRITVSGTNIVRPAGGIFNVTGSHAGSIPHRSGGTITVIVVAAIHPRDPGKNLCSISLLVPARRQPPQQ